MNKIIYKVTHKESGKVYIGTTSDSLTNRINDHLQKARNGKGSEFHRAISKLGLDSFSWEVIDTANSTNEAAQKEQIYVQKHNKEIGCYNADRGGGISKKVYQYDGRGKLIKTFPSLEKAAKSVGVDKKTISKACLGAIKTCAGYHWSYQTFYDFLNYGDKRRKQVVQYDMKGTLIKVFKSVSIASTETRITKSSIAKCCRGEYKNAGSYQWRYLE